MSKISKTQFYEIRNNVYGGLVENGTIKESDVTFVEIEQMIISSLGLDIDWDDERPIDMDTTMMDNAYHYLCNDDVSVEEQVEAIQKQADIDGSVMIDYVEGVTVWEKVENAFSCDEFLDLIS